MLCEWQDFYLLQSSMTTRRVGFVEREAPSKLITSVNELYKLYEVREDVTSAPAWDFMWGTTVEEGREKQLRGQAFTKEPDCMYENTRNEKVQLAEEALKACIFIIIFHANVYTFADGLWHT